MKTKWELKLFIFVLYKVCNIDFYDAWVKFEWYMIVFELFNFVFGNYYYK